MIEIKAKVTEIKKLKLPPDFIRLVFDKKTGIELVIKLSDKQSEFFKDTGEELFERMK